MEKGIPIVPRNRYTKSRQDFRKVRQFFFFTFVSSDVKYIYICVFSCNSLVALLSSVLRPARSFLLLDQASLYKGFSSPRKRNSKSSKLCFSLRLLSNIPGNETKRKEKKEKKKKTKQRGSTFKSFFLTFSLCVTTIRKRCTRAHTPAGPGKK